MRETGKVGRTRRGGSRRSVFPLLGARSDAISRLTLSGIFVLWLAACGSGPPPPAISSVFVRINPVTVTLPAAQSQQFTATVGGSANQSVAWSVDGAPGGSTAAGTISATGLYKAPVIAPSQGSATVTATSKANTTASASAVVSITPVISVAIVPSSDTLAVTQSQQFTAIVTGSANQSVSWSVNGVGGGDAAVGTVSPGGIYTTPLIVPNPGSVTLTATSHADSRVSASAVVGVLAAVVDFSTLPTQFETNLGTFLVTGSVPAGSKVAVNGASAPLDNAGNFVVPVSLNAGPNPIELITSTPNGTSTVVRTINYDPSFSTASIRLLYVSSVNPNLPGTIVLDVDNNVFLGFIPNKHVRGISPDGSKIYMDDRSVFSTATNQELAPPASPLAFTAEIPSDGFLVSPDGTKLYSRTEVLDTATNQLLAPLPVSIETGSTFDGPAQGGPAISQDGHTIYCGILLSGSDLNVISTSDDSIASVVIAQSGVFGSDIGATPDGKLLLITSYAFGVGYAQIFSASSFENLASLALGDFAGQIVVSPDGTKAIFGAAGNPEFGGGGVLVVDLATLRFDTRIPARLADHLAISDLDQLFVSSGDTPGVDEYQVLADGTLQALRRFDLGINQFVEGEGSPQNDDIEKMVFKP